MEENRGPEKMGAARLHSTMYILPVCRNHWKLRVLGLVTMCLVVRSALARIFPPEILVRTQNERQADILLGLARYEAETRKSVAMMEVGSHCPIVCPSAKAKIRVRMDSFVKKTCRRHKI